MNSKPSYRRGSGVKRRDFLRAAPTSLAAGMFATVAGEAQPADETTSRLRSAGALSGLEFTDAEHQLMRAAVERNGERYTALRDLTIPDDTDPRGRVLSLFAG